MKNIGIWIQAIFILILFIVCVVLPSLNSDELGFSVPILTDYNSKMILGIIHINSVIFIFGSAIILWLTVDRTSNKAVRAYENKSIKDAEKHFEDYFQGKINILDLKNKEKSNDSIKEVLKILKFGGIEDDLLLGIQKIYNTIDNSYSKLKNDYEYAATLMPIIGMIGTVAGLLMMFAEPSQAEDFEKKFAGLSLALATTLYASLITVIIFKPLARQKEKQQIELENDFNDLEISVRKFYHRINMVEFLEICDNLDKQEVGNEEEKI
ncbi:MotA/TolQ/ExbB proton channel family protein [Aliarcobacter cryaerophilus]|uniref:MotA/TolQ/ExbB proton channel family protein n=1 Tax=Aliarcobacter cryaerophilus TaxID=28198 RepID=UPI00165478E0|nr:MotA/TolQ/ExbB proton channel family protein [Aliarcobacter cryaerophilus]QNM88888.1 MotA/TolQ/ExbB proton channel family protein [Aliarcobacter cryaerophilus]